MGEERICVCEDHSLYRAVTKIEKSAVRLFEYHEFVKVTKASQEIGLIVKSYY